MSYFGIYRADVINANDPEQRLRVQVRVRGIHHPSMPDLALPWAEPAGVLRGLFFPYEKGDVVFVQFEGGSHLYPVIVGGSLSEKQGVNDTPFELQEDNSGGKKVILVDGKGSMVEMSTDPRDLWVRLRSGGAIIQASSKDNGVVIEARGAVVVSGPKVTVNASTAEVNAGTINISADNGSAQSAVLTANSQHRTDVLAVDDVNIGNRVENIMGIPQTTQPQAQNVNLRGANVNVGVGGGVMGTTPETDAMPSATSGAVVDVPLLPTITVNIRAATDVNIVAGVGVSVESPSVSVTGTASVSLSSSASVAIHAPSISLGA